MSFFLTFGFLTLSLLNHTTYIYIAGLVLIAIYAMIKGRLLHFRENEILSFLAFSLFILLSALYFLIFTENPADESVKSFNNNLVFSFILFFIGFIIYKITISDNCEKDLKNAIRNILAIHVSVFIIQFLIVYSTGSFIDFVKPITGEESRYMNYILSGSLSSLIQYRATGLYVEPSTYASAMTCMILAGLALKINRKLIYVATITLLLNFSSVGIIVFLVVMGSLFFEKIRLYKIALSVVLIFLFIVINYEFIINFTTDFFNKFESTAGSRFKLIDYVLFYRHGYINIFGVGYFNIPKELYMEINSGAYSMAAINDAGLISFILLKFGLISLPFVYWIFKNVNGRVSKIVFTGVLLTKISFLFPILYIGLLPAIFKGRNTAR